MLLSLLLTTALPAYAHIHHHWTTGAMPTGVIVKDYPIASGGSVAFFSMTQATGACSITDPLGHGNFDYNAINATYNPTSATRAACRLAGQFYYGTGNCTLPSSTFVCSGEINPTVGGGAGPCTINSGNTMKCP